jgi:hypothetical protein
MRDGFEQITETIPLGRAADPGEIAETIVFLASDRVSYLNGAVIPIDGARVGRCKSPDNNALPEKGGSAAAASSPGPAAVVRTRRQTAPARPRNEFVIVRLANARDGARVAQRSRTT